MGQDNCDEIGEAAETRVHVTNAYGFDNSVLGRIVETKIIESQWMFTGWR